MAACAQVTVERARLNACIALEAVLPLHAANAGASVAVFAMFVSVEHPIVAVEAKRVTGLLRRRHAGQWNVGEYPDWGAFAIVVLVGVLHPVVQHVKMRHGLGHVLLFEVRKQQHELDGGVGLLYVQQRRRQCLQRCRERRVDNYEIASLQHRLHGITLAREHGHSCQHVVAIK